MKKIVWMMVFAVFSALAFADNEPVKPVLDMVGFQVTAKQWVHTQSALVQVNINATLTNTNLVKARAEIMDRLSKIAAGDWHLISFNRSQDSSGLEKLSVRASARVGQNSLTDLYQNAKAVSKPGMRYQIGSIEFKPSLEEVQKAKSQLRNTLYKKADQEMARINKVYNGQTYSIYRLFFVEGDMPLPQGAFKSREMLNTVALAASAPHLAVSDELKMTAVVEVASTRKKEG